MTTVAFDTETKGLAWHDPDEQAFLASWADGDGEYTSDLSDEDEREKFLAALRGADEIVAHNLSFDVHQTRETLGFDVTELGAKLHDTDLLSRVLFPSGQSGAWTSHGLKNLAKVHLRADAGEAEESIERMAKEIGLRTVKQTGAYFDVWRAYPEVMERYAALDARYTYDLFSKFEPQLNGLRKVYELEMAVAPVIIRAEARGVAVDQAYVQELKAQFTGELEAVTASLNEVLGEDFEGDALADKLVELGVPLWRKTPTGKLATHQFAFQEFEDEHPIMGDLQEYRRLTKFLSTYIGALDGVDVVHPSFMQCGAWTGRMSCRRPNLQNWPKRAGKEVRGTLVPRPGHAFVVYDYESIEARLLAYYLADDGYRQLIEDGHDPHAWMAASIHGGEMSMYLKGTPGESERAVAKNTTFAIVYGAGAPRVADMNKIPVEDARALIAKIKSSLPNFRHLQGRIRNKVETLGYVNTIYGRKQVVPKDKGYVGLNALIQGSAADIMKLGIVAVDAAVRDLGGVPVLFVHDEIVVECPIEHAEECGRLMAEAMVQPGIDLGLSPTLSVEGSITMTSYADA